MKKILSIFTVFIFIFALVACKPGVDPAQEKIDAAASGLAVLIKDPNAITSSFNVPTKLKDGVVAAWSSSEPGVISVGEPSSDGTVQITVNRPSKGSGNTKVTLTAMLTIKAEKGSGNLEKKWEIDLTVIEQSVEEIKIETIRDILNIRDDAYDPADKKDKVQVTIKNASVFAKGSDSVFIYDGTGITQVYGGDSSKMVVGKVYDVTGLLEWYFGLWEIIDSTAIEVTGTAQIPEKVTVDNVLEFIGGLTEDGGHLPADGTAKDGNFEPIYARVTAKVHVIPGDTTNYNTYLLSSDFEGDFLGGPQKPAKGFMAYYMSNDFNYIKGFDGLEVNMDVVLYTYRSNNYAFAFYYVGGPEGIELGELSDEDKITLDFNAISIAGSYTEAATLNLITEGEQGTEFAWSYTDEENENNELIDLATGKITPVEGEMKVLKITVTATNGEAEEVKNYEIAVGNYEVSTIESIITGELTKGDPIRVIGILLGGSAPTTYFIADVTGGLGIYVPNNSELQEAFKGYPVGTVLDMTGTYDLFNGLHQISGVTMNTHKVVDGLILYQESVDISEYDDFSTESLEDLHGLKVKLEGLTLKADIPAEFNSFNFTLVRADGKEIAARLDNRMPYAEAVYEYLKDFKAGDVLDIDGLVVSFYNSPQLVFVDNPFAEVPELSTIKAVNEGELENDTPIRVKGILTGGTTPSAFWLQDETGGINLYVPSALRALFAKLTPGVELEITGEYEIYNGMHELKNFSISTIKLLNDEPALPEPADVSELAWTAEAFKDHHGSLVKVVGFTMKADGPEEDKSINITIVSPEGVEFIVRYDNRMDFSKAIFNYLKTLKAGDEIDIDMVVVGWYNGPQLAFVSNPFAE